MVDVNGTNRFAGLLGFRMRPERRSGCLSSRLELLNLLGAVDVRLGRSEWRVIITIVDFDFRNIFVDSGISDLGLDVGYLTQ